MVAITAVMLRGVVMLQEITMPLVVRAAGVLAVAVVAAEGIRLSMLTFKIKPDFSFFWQGLVWKRKKEPVRFFDKTAYTF